MVYDFSIRHSSGFGFLFSSFFASAHRLQHPRRSDKLLFLIHSIS